MAASAAPREVSPTGLQADEHAVQIVTINDDGSSFELQDEALSSVLRKVPPKMKVAVLAIAGAFRTGKSFLLNFFLRYLRCYDEGADGDREPMVKGPRVNKGESNWIMADEPLHGSANRPAGSALSPEEAAAEERRSFAYRHGDERMTTGIWMWSRPFFITQAHGGERVAVLVVDTQGMFDRKTGMRLTSSIFGLSTLLSSLQVYNITKNVQEDHLQNLALFSEYGRTAEAAEDRPEAAAAASASSGRAETEARPPFQAVSILVRDCDSFEVDAATFDPARLEAENELKMAAIMAEAVTEDIANTRSAIDACYEHISLCRIVNPGKAVTRSTFSGDVRDVDPDFLCIVEHFVDSTIRKRLKPKAVRHVAVTATETLRFMRVYARLFRDATTFPEPQSILDATADANNRNAVTHAFERYDEELTGAMDEAGSEAVPAEEMERVHAIAREGAVGVFNSRATFGPDHLIHKARSVLCERIDERWEVLKKLNTARDPFRFLTMIGIPFLAMLMAYVSAFATDTVCSPWLSLCGALGQFLRFVASVLFLGLAAFFLARGSNALKHIQRFVKLLSSAAGPAGPAAVLARVASSPAPAREPAAGRDAADMPPLSFEDDSASGMRRRRSRRT